MKKLGGILVAVSIAFVVFSVVYAAKYEKLREDYRRTGYTGDYDAFKRNADRIHSVVKPVSLAYFGLFLALFIRAVRVPIRRAVSIVGIVAAVFMGLWSAMLDGGISFDEVYPAWIVAALVLPGLVFAVVQPASRGHEAAVAA